MGVRNRTSMHANARKLRQANAANDKRFSRRKAEFALTHGADPTETRFTKHQNKHVVAKAARMAAALTAHVEAFAGDHVATE